MQRNSIPRKGESKGEGLGCVGVVLVIGVILLLSNSKEPHNPLRFVKPPVPVVVSTRPSLIGVGEVAIFSNQTSNRLTITVEFENKKTNQKKRGTIDLEPNGKEEIGWAEGWMFESGETITISHPNYSSKTVTIP